MAVNHCGDVNPIAWLTENWANMIDTVMTLASNVGHEAQENTIGTISKAEAKEALRKHKGNIWASVTECVEGRQQKVSSSLIPSCRLLKFKICNFNLFRTSQPPLTSYLVRGAAEQRQLLPGGHSDHADGTRRKL